MNKGRGSQGDTGTDSLGKSTTVFGTVFYNPRPIDQSFVKQVTGATDFSLQVWQNMSYVHEFLHAVSQQSLNPLLRGSHSNWLTALQNKGYDINLFAMNGLSSDDQASWGFNTFLLKGCPKK